MNQQAAPNDRGTSRPGWRKARVGCLVVLLVPVALVVVGLVASLFGLGMNPYWKLPQDQRPKAFESLPVDQQISVMLDGQRFMPPLLEEEERQMFARERGSAAIDPLLSRAAGSKDGQHMMFLLGGVLPVILKLHPDSCTPDLGKRVAAIAASASDPWSGMAWGDLRESCLGSYLR